MNKKSQLLSLTLIILMSCQNQEFEQINLSQKDSNNLYVNDGESNMMFYLKLIPDEEIKGAIVILPASGETIHNLIKQIELPYLAYNKGIATIIPSINWGTEDRAVEIETLNAIFQETVEKHNIPKEKFVLGGLSNGGMISLIYAQQSVKKIKKLTLNLKVFSDWMCHWIKPTFINIAKEK